MSIYTALAQGKGGKDAQYNENKQAIMAYISAVILDINSNSKCNLSLLDSGIHIHNFIPSLRPILSYIANANINH